MFSPGHNARAMQVAIIPVTPFQQNCSVLWCERTRRAAVVDPGGDLERVQQVLDDEGLTLERILITHGHLDHAAGTAELARRNGVPVEGPHEGDEVRVGDETLQVRHCPGHTPGHVVFVHSTARFAIVGDVLFAGSIGRTDFPRGDHAQLLTSIRERLFPLGDDITFLPGHGPTSTFGTERRSNPYVADRLFPR